MATKKNSTRSIPRISHVYIQSALRPDMERIERVPIDTSFEFAWEFNTNDGTEYLEARLSGAQLLKIAAERGRLTMTTSGRRALPQGMAAVAKVVARA